MSVQESVRTAVGSGETIPGWRAVTAGPGAVRAVVGVLLVIAASGSVQLSALLSQTLFDRIDPFGVSGLRFAVAALAMLAVVRPSFRGRRASEWLLIACYGTSIAAMNVCMYRAIAGLPLGVAITLEFLGPFAIAVFAARRPRQALYAGIGLVGVVMIARPSGGIDPIGLVFGLFAAAALAGYIICADRVGAKGGGMAQLSLAFCVAAALTSPFALTAIPAVRPPDLLTIGGSAALGVLLAFMADFLAIRVVGARTVAVLLAFDPVLAAILGATFAGEHLDALTLLGMGCVALAGGLAAVGCARTALDTGRPTAAPPRKNVGEPPRGVSGSKRCVVHPGA